MPLGLAQQAPSLYLIVRFEGYDNYRHLALHRILVARVYTRTFERPADFDLEQYDADGHFAFGEGKYFQISFRIRTNVGGFLRETPLSKIQKIEVQKDWLKITATVPDDFRMAHWLESFGDAVERDA
jgi:hypothetical protein